MFDVTGMTCSHCVQAMTDAVKRTDPATVAVDLPTGQVRIDSAAPPPSLQAAIVDAGYDVVGSRAA